MEDLAGVPLEKWATAENLGIKGFNFTKAADFYPFIYQRRFRDFKEQGYAFLEAAMSGAEPSYGYSVLAQIMANLNHKVAVTTNFDNLIADAISIYTNAFPLVCGHESLTGFIRPNLTRPVIAKIHRDLLLNPKSEPEEIENLPPEWEEALKVIFENNTPIILGYGGNDGSLMGFFKKLSRIKGGIFWCYRSGKEPDQRIHEIVEHHHGRLVPILGFDELMLQLWEKLQLASPITALQSTYDKRKVEFQRQFEELNKKLKQPGGTKVAEAELKEVRVAAAAAVQRLTREKDWWAWQLKADAEIEPSTKEKIFQEGLKDFPESAELTGNFALYMANVAKKYNEAERLYLRAIELDPADSDYVGNFANLVNSVHKDHDRAERLYRKALELGPKNANNTGNFANFMMNIRKDYDEAERLYRKALEADPKHANNTGNFAIFVKNIRKDFDQAERLYRHAIELDPNNANHTGNFANFMKDIRKDYNEANRLYVKALQLDPLNALNTSNYAAFFQEVEKNYDEAERLYRRAMELGASAGSIGRFAVFMESVRKDYNEAEGLYRTALADDPTHVSNLCNFADFMDKVRNDPSEANRLFKLALTIDPSFEWGVKTYSEFQKKHPEVAS